MQLCIHRGTNEIGGSCVELTSQGKRIIIDLGLPLEAESNDKKYLPDIKGLDGTDDTLLAIIISHPHIDHFGLLTHISTKIPIIIGEDARRIINMAKVFMKEDWPEISDGINLQSQKSFEIGPFKITPHLVDHSGYDSYSLFIEADGKRLFYSGDLRMHGRKSKLTERLIENPPDNIDVLLLEGSSLGRLNNSESFPSESDIENDFVKAISDSSGLTLVHTSSQNIDRIVSIFRACKRTGRRMIIDLYTAVILKATGNTNIPQSSWKEIALFIPQSQRVMIKENELFDLLKEHSLNRIFIDTIEKSPSEFVLLFRPLYKQDLEKSEIIKNTEYIYSMWEGYWEQESNSHLRDWLSKHNIPKVSIHTSGHASPADLKRFAEAINPKTIVPIHTFYPEEYKNLFTNIKIIANGETLEV
ncbi:MAG: MBL fold metallo-hydrolase [Ignavibacteria bacterium]